MKLHDFIFTTSIILTSTLILSAQENCKVLKEEISGKYEGNCKNGLAHGNGLAIGKDIYHGKFKKGLPHGYGTYTWLTGEKYVGYFKEGKRNGKGNYSFSNHGKDSTYNGMWKNDSLTKIILPPKYKIEKNINVTRYSIQRMSTGNRVLFLFLQNGVANTTITNFHLISTKGTNTSLGEKQGFENIQFPVTCKVTYLTLSSSRVATLRVEFEVTINEPGDWVITLHN